MEILGQAGSSADWLRRSPGSNGLELRLLLIAERGIEILKRGAHQLDCLQHGIEPLAGGGEPRGRRQGVAGRTFQRGTLRGTTAQDSWLYASLCVSLDSRPVGVVGRRWPGLIFGERIK